MPLQGTLSFLSRQASRLTPGGYGWSPQKGTLVDAEVAREMLKWIILGVGINATALLGIMGGILVLGMHLSKGLRELSLSNERISATAERVAEMTAQILRNQQ